MNYVSSTKPQGCLIKECANGNNDAALCASAIYCYIDWLDNIIDRDVVVSYETSAKTSLNLFVMLSYNKFWDANKIHLAPILVTAYNAWMDSERMKAHPDYRVRIAGDVLKGYFLEVFFQIGFITGGYDLMRALSEKWRGFNFDAFPNINKEPAFTRAEKWAPVDGPRGWIFPLDHESHPGYRMEWWYFSGILNVGIDRKGYHFCQFRIEDKFIQHLSMTDLGSGHFTFEESTSEKNIIEFEVADRMGLKYGPLDLEFKQGEPVFLQGEKADGYSVKSEIPGHASHYYSIRHLRTTGTINGFPVSDNSWFDHEFGTVLKPDSIRWVFFHACFESGATINGYLMVRDEKLDLPHSRLVYVNENDKVSNWSHQFNCATVPSIQDPSFLLNVVRDNPLSISVELLTENKTCKSSLGEYLELPCKVKMMGVKPQEAFGYLEITSS